MFGPRSAADSAETVDCDVAIVGCGPTGVVLANLLGALGTRVVVLEREREVYPVPRATHIDEETLRNFQATGLADALFANTEPFRRIDVVDADGSVLLTEPLGDPKSPHGYSGSRFFDQPAFERVLREGLDRYSSVSLRCGVEVTEVVDDERGATVRTRSLDGEDSPFVRASWVVGCDGGKSVVRERLAAQMEPIAPKRPWLIVDTVLRDGAAAALLPDAFRYVLATDRLSIYAHGVGLHRRWEFQLADDEPMPERDEVLRWVSAFVDLAHLEISRIMPYAHTSLIAKRWRAGRLLVAGDAAHMMPPSAGQGMCSGVRDAVNLAWKLHEVVARRAGDSLLDTYETERKPHVREILEGALYIGRRMEAETGFQRWRRRQQLRIVGSLPRVQARLRARSVRRPNLRAGFLDAGSRLAGRPMPQVEVVDERRERRLDDVTGYRFALVARSGALDDADTDWAASRGICVWPAGEGSLARWLSDERLDFAIVRPDRQLFAAGRAAELARARASFDRWFA